MSGLREPSELVVINIIILNLKYIYNPKSSEIWHPPADMATDIPQ